MDKWDRDGRASFEVIVFLAGDFKKTAFNAWPAAEVTLVWCSSKTADPLGLAKARSAGEKGNAFARIQSHDCPFVTRK